MAQESLAEHAASNCKRWPITRSESVRELRGRTARPGRGRARHYRKGKAAAAKTPSLLRDGAGPSLSSSTRPTRLARYWRKGGKAGRPAGPGANYSGGLIELMGYDGWLLALASRGQRKWAAASQPLAPAGRPPLSTPANFFLATQTQCTTAWLVAGGGTRSALSACCVPSP
jgi:hypothetical protein